MKGDFSRNSFDPNKHYRGVRMQQGRVQMDADWNEQIDITDHRDRLFTEDFLGVAVGPNVGAGYAIGATTDKQDLTIGLGRYYVDGLLAENSSSLYFTQQTNYPQAVLPNQNGVYLTYLEVWQRSLSIADDADMAESALSGADTTTRLYTVAQVKLMPIDSTGISTLTYAALFNSNAASETSAYNNIQQWNALTNRLPSNVNAVQLLPDVGKMTSTAKTTYRIQIHQGGNAEQATYKTSNENPLVQVAITTINVSDPNAQKVTLANQPLDGQIAFKAGQWLELTTPTRNDARIPGDFVLITDTNDVVLTVSGIIGIDIINSVAGVAIAKRWQNNALAITHSAQYPLETGLTIHFLGKTFESGGYWNIVTDATTIHWPKSNNQFIALPPNSNTISQLTPTVVNPSLQNQLYRVEIHQGGDASSATFKWSRDNASVSSSINIISSNNITLATLPQDGINDFMIYQWLELTTPARELTCLPGDMVQIVGVNGAILTVNGDLGADITVANHAIARRWDTAVTINTSQAVNSVIPSTPNTPIPLENGLSISFSGGDFQTGDYWLIPARAAINSQRSHIDWPLDANGNFLAEQPQGIQRSYAPLAIVQRSNGAWNFESDARTIAIAQNEYVSINALQQGTYVTTMDVGSVNAIVLKPANVYSSYAFGTQIEFLAQYTNTGPTSVTINSNATANLVIQTPSGVLSTSGGEVVAGNIYRILFDGKQWQLMNPTIQNQLDQYVSIINQQQSTYVYGNDVGSVNTVVVNPVNNYGVYVPGTVIEVLIANTNTGNATLNINSQGAIAIQVATPLGLRALTGNEMVVGTISTFKYNGSTFQLMNPQVSLILSSSVSFQSATTQIIPKSTATVIQYNNVLSDLYSWWDSINFRFLPTIPGRYLVNQIMAGYCASSTGGFNSLLFKNGFQFRSLGAVPGIVVIGDGASTGYATGSCEIILNGSTDYVDMRGGTDPMYSSTIGTISGGFFWDTDSSKNMLFEIQYLGN